MESLVLLLMLLLAGCGLAGCGGQKMESTPSKIAEAPQQNKTAQGNKPQSMPMPVPTTEAKSSRINTLPSSRPQEERRANSKNNMSQQLHRAAIAFDVPSNIKMGDRVTAQLLINLTKEVENLVDDLKTKQAKINEKVEVSHIVLATLTGPDFTITPITPLKQGIFDNKNTEWLWYLEPKEPGNHEISLDITAIVKVDGERAEHHIKTFNKTISVKIEPADEILNFIKSYWQWLFTVLLLPIIKYFWGKRKKAD